MLTVLLCSILGAIANRFSGFTNISWLPGRNIYWAGLFLFLVAWPFMGLGWALAIATSVFTYRIPSWNHSLDMGTRGDSLRRDARMMFYRTLYLFPVFAYALFQGLWIAPLLLVIAAAGATAAYIAGLYGPQLFKDQFNLIEPLAGAVMGAMVGLTYVLS